MQQTPPREQYLLSSVSSHKSENKGATQVPGQSSIDSFVTVAIVNSGDVVDGGDGVVLVVVVDVVVDVLVGVVVGLPFDEKLVQLLPNLLDSFCFTDGSELLGDD